MILTREDVSFSKIGNAYRPTAPDQSYVAAARIFTRGKQSILVINVYSPPARWTAGQGTQEQTFQPESLLVDANRIVAGDVNAHSHTWDPHQPEDAQGHRIEDWILTAGMSCLNDGAPTRVNPATGGKSAPDITVVSASLAGGATWSTTDNMGSDHLPVITTFPRAHDRPKRRGRGRLALKKAAWATYSRKVDELIAGWNQRPEDLTITQQDRRLTDTIMTAAKRTIPFGNGGKSRQAFWNEACDEVIRRRDEAFRKATAPDHSAEDITAYKEARAEADDTLRREKADFLHQQVMGMGPSTDMWGLLRTLDGRKPPARPAEPLTRPTTPGQPPPLRPAISDKEKANLLCREYAKVARIPKDKAADHPIKLEARAALKSRNCCDGQRTDICAPFSQAELAVALEKISNGKSPGPDGLPNELLKNLSRKGREHLLALINRSWHEGATPASWRSAVIVAIPKKGKPPSETGSYRPISLLSSISKVAERLLQARLQHWLESNNKLNVNQAGFRRGHSTTDQVGRFTQRIFDAFEERPPNRAVLVLLDFARAYDRVWRAALLAKMARLGIPGCVIRWVRAFLTDRRARVRWGATLSDSRVFQEGLPQGSVLAPLLWLIYVNDIDNDMPQEVTRSLYADDVAMLASDKSIEKCCQTLQPCLNKVDEWLLKWKVTPSISKCSATAFSLDPKEQGGRAQPRLSMRGEPLVVTQNPTFLGIKFDGQLTFTEHVNDLKKKMAQRRQCLQALAGKKYGSHRKTLRTAYIGYIRALYDYGAAVYGTHCAPAVREKLEAEQNKCARLITGCIRLTRTGAFTAEADLVPLTVRAKQLAGYEYQRMVRLPEDDPTRALMLKSPAPRLKYRAHEAWTRACSEAAAGRRPPPKPPDEDVTLTHKPCLRRVGRWMAEGAELATIPVEPLALHRCRPPWSPGGGAVWFVVSLPIATRKTDPPDKRREAALRAIAELPETDVTIWSDGSAGGGTRNGGAGALVELHRLNREVEVRAPAGSVCSSLRAELTAIKEALAVITSLDAEERQQTRRVRLLTDSLSGLQLLRRGPGAQTSALATEVWRLIHELEDGDHTLTFQWVPGHAGVTGNEAADRLAAEATTRDQTQAAVDLASARGAIRRRAVELARARAQEAHPFPAATPGHDELTRWESVTVAQLRTGFSPLTRDTLLRLELAGDDRCPACAEPDSVEHLLTDCSAYVRIRGRLWGFTPTLKEIFEEPAHKIMEFLRRVGRTDPPPRRRAPAAGPLGGPCVACKERERVAVWRQPSTPSPLPVGPIGATGTAAVL